MSDTSNNPIDNMSEMLQEMNDAVADSVEQNMKAQAAFMESCADAVEETVPEQNELAEGFEGYNRAYEVWMDAADKMFERSTDAAQGEEVDASEIRDIWLQSANEAFKEVRSTSAFASANGQLVEAMLDLQDEADEVTQDTISQMGLPTRDDVMEVGERLVELERRQHRVEEKLDQILEEL